VTELAVVEPNGLYPHSDENDVQNYACDVRLKNSGLVLKQVPVMTGHIGTAVIPNEGDLVLLAYSQGSANQPVIIGRLYNDADRPPLNNADEVIFRLPLAQPDNKTVKGAIRNRSGSRELLVEMSPKIELHLDDSSITARAGKSQMRLTQAGQQDGKVTVEAGGSTITMNQDGDITIEARGGITLRTSTGDVTIQGNNVTIKGAINTTVEAGAQAKLSGSVSATIDGGVNTTMRGTTLTLQGITSFT
jgi:uncharacterized protein involved in type VI secretion and phage assembly